MLRYLGRTEESLSISDNMIARFGTDEAPAPGTVVEM